MTNQMTETRQLPFLQSMTFWEHTTWIMMLMSVSLEEKYSFWFSLQNCLAKSLNLHTHLRRKGASPLILTLKTTCLTTGRQAQPAVQSHCPIQLNASPNQKWEVWLLNPSPFPCRTIMFIKRCWTLDLMTAISRNSTQKMKPWENCKDTLTGIRLSPVKSEVISKYDWRAWHEAIRAFQS